MTTDLLEQLARVRPWADDSIDAPLDDGLEQLLRDVLAAPSAPETHSAPRRRVRRARWWVGVGVGLGIAGGAVGAWAYGHRAPATQPAGVLCRSGSASDAPSAVVPRSDDPTVDCATVWVTAGLGSEPVPPLVACVDQRGQAVVLPVLDADGSTLGACADAGLTDLDRSPTATDGRGVSSAVTRMLQQRLDIALHGACTSTGDAVELAHRTLDDLSLDGWSVEVVPGLPASRPCAIPAVDPARLTVVITAVTKEQL